MRKRSANKVKGKKNRPKTKLGISCRSCIPMQPASMWEQANCSSQWAPTVTCSRCADFVTALNIGTMGFFWWYTPEYISRYFEKIRDVEHDSEIIVDRTPMLKIVWPPQALKSPDLNNISIVYSFIAQANQQQFESTHRYFRNLGLMAKNDIFFQFEPTIFIEFISALKDAMAAYGDWDGKPETAETSITSFFEGVPATSEFTGMVRDFLNLVDQMIANKIAPRPVTLDDVARAKLIFDGYIKVKAQRWYMDELAKRQGESDLLTD